MRYVQGVRCPDTQRELDALVNQAAEAHGFDPAHFLGGAIAESGLREYAVRNGTWPDVSYGLFQQAVKWLGREVPSLTRAPDGTVYDTPANRATAQTWAWDAANQVAYTAPRYASLLRRASGDPLLAWCLWNAPSLDWSNPDPQHAANREHYRRSLATAEQYVVEDTESTEEVTPVTLAVSDERAHWADLTKHQYGSYDRRSLASVTRAVVHYSDGNRDAGPQAIYDWQTSWGAAGQTGTGSPFPNIAYHFVVDGGGTVHWIHDLSLTTWHAGNANSTSFAVMFTGNNEATLAQKPGIAIAIAFGEQQLGRPVAIVGHQNVNSTGCPGTAWPNWRGALERAVADIRNGSPVVTPPAPGVDPTGGKTMLPGSTMPQYIREQGLGAAFTDETPCLGGSMLFSKDGAQVYTVLYRAYTQQLKHLAW